MNCLPIGVHLKCPPGYNINVHYNYTPGEFPRPLFQELAEPMEITPEIITIIEGIANRLASRYRFGYHDIDDIKQQAFIEAEKGLKKYDGKRPLENFLYIHIKNRLYNYKRDNYERLDKPCFHCPLNAYIKVGDVCTAYTHKDECEPYNEWLVRNSSKKNIMSPVDIGDEPIFTSHVQGPEDEAEENEMIKIIDRELPVELRSDYLKMKAGHKIAKKNRLAVQDSVLDIMRRFGYAD